MSRARDHGIVIGDLPTGPLNAITDVAGVRVGHTTLVSGSGPRDPGNGPVRTGVTVVIPRDEPWNRPLFAAPHRLNGNGELTGQHWVAESGQLTSYIGLTNTHSVGVVRDALIAHEKSVRGDEFFFSLPVVGETCDGILNDLNGFHVRPQHVEAAIADASGGPVQEGAVGGGTGMIAHGYKGGIGTSSRVAGDHTVGVLVQANHGARERLMIDGVPVGRLLPPPPTPTLMPGQPPEGTGSIIVLVATDAPLIPTQCARLAQRAALGIARTGGAGENGSGDIAFCFATGNDVVGDFAAAPGPDVAEIKMLANRLIDGLFYATVEATEEAIINAMFAGETMEGPDGLVVTALPREQAADLVKRHRDLAAG
ncbi:DmpA family aminopeptidase [Mycolicibacterium elephantis]|uniref:D-aminopeptidase n=1 Tax=Mycolicibacterium elephantis DSM 44368 TaxID=1335622 RepID=A0A439DWT0_9MYCO|nr:P1 family peptidase [Mycolicibacterium elephantis]MCV7222997.1 P1 family peptidase [Mycolicibacterium elephantis]RWA21677.1 D-aminopeptidase [Mycolicibacterium elephantis DSM 44368]